MTVILKETQSVVQIVDDIKCNRCGKTCRSEIGNFECLRFQETWGYGSRRDSEKWSGHLCEDCSELFEDWLESKGGHIDKVECLLDGTPITT